MSRVQSERVVFISSEVRELMVSLGRSFAPLETGGILVGYRSHTAIAVTHIIGPGPGATHESTAFEPHTP